MRRNSLFFFVLTVLLAAASARAQLVEDFNPPRANCCLPALPKTLADQLPGLEPARPVHAANLELRTSRPTRTVWSSWEIHTHRLGTWPLLPGKRTFNRGISGRPPADAGRMYPT